MAQGSKKGACSANVQPAKANCLQHNRRDENSTRVPSHVNPHESYLNHTIFEDEMIKGRKSIVPFVKRAELLYTEKTGQKCQSSFVPFREDVLSLPGRGDISDEQILDYLRTVEEKFGVKPIGAWYHKDEGHPHSKYIEGDENFEKNYHVHVLYSCQDKDTGKAIRLPRSFYTLRQDFLSKATGLERGNPAAETRRERRSASQQRIHAMEERIRMLEEEYRKRDLKAQEDVKRLEDEKNKLEEEIKTLRVGKAAKEKLLGALRQSKKDKEIAQLKATVEGEPGRIATAVAAARADERQLVITEIKEAANLRIGKDGKETAQIIGKAWRESYNGRKTLINNIDKLKELQKNELGNREKSINNLKEKIEGRDKIIYQLWPDARNAVKAIFELASSPTSTDFNPQQALNVEKAIVRSGINRIDAAIDLLGLSQKDFEKHNTPKAYIEGASKVVMSIAKGTHQRLTALLKQQPKDSGGGTSYITDLTGWDGKPIHR